MFQGLRIWGVACLREQNLSAIAAFFSPKVFQYIRGGSARDLAISRATCKVSSPGAYGSRGEAPLSSSPSVSEQPNQ